MLDCISTSVHRASNIGNFSDSFYFKLATTYSVAAKPTDQTFVAISDVSDKQDILAVFSETSSTLADDESSKRVRKCSGCKLPRDVHSWGPPGPYCTGPAEDAEADEDDEEALKFCNITKNNC